MRPTSLSQLKTALLCIVILSSLAACGSRLSNTSGSNTLPGTPTGTSMKNNPQANPTVTPGQVTLVLNASHYGVKDTIIANILNGLSQPVYISMYHTNCTPLILEKETDTTWAPQGNCLKIQSAPNPFIQRKPCSITQQQLRPFSGTTGSISDSWQSGTYRITISYAMTFDPDSIQGGMLVRSETFSIG